MDSSTKTQPAWRNSNCVGGNCDTVYHAGERNGRRGNIVIAEQVTGDDLAGLAHQPGPGEVAVFVTADMRAHLEDAQ